MLQRRVRQTVLIWSDEEETNRVTVQNNTWKFRLSRALSL